MLDTFSNYLRSIIISQERLLGAALGAMFTGAVVFEERKAIYRSILGDQSHRVTSSEVTVGVNNKFVQISMSLNSWIVFPKYSSCRRSDPNLKLIGNPTTYLGSRFSRTTNLAISLHSIVIKIQIVCRRGYIQPPDPPALWSQTSKKTHINIA